MGICKKIELKIIKASYYYSCSGSWSTQTTIVKELLHYSDAVQFAEVPSRHCGHVLHSILHPSDVSIIFVFGWNWVSLKVFILVMELKEGEGEEEEEEEEEPYHYYSF